MTGHGRAIMLDVTLQATSTDRATMPEVISIPSELRAMSKGRIGGAVAQVVTSFFEGALEAAILTLFARLALRAVGDDTGSIYVPGIGDRPLQYGVAILIGLIFLRLGAGVLNAALSSHLQFALVRSLRHDALSAYSSSSWLTQSQLDDGEVQQLVVTVPNGISGLLSGLLTHFGHIAIMIAMLGYAMLTDVRLTSGLILLIVFSTLTFHPLRSLIKGASRRALNHQKELSSGVAQLVATRFEAQTFGLLEAASAPLHAVVESEADQSARVARLKASIVPLFTTVTYLAVAISIVIIMRADTASLDRTGPILLVVLRSLSYGTAIQQAAAGIANLGPSLELFRQRVNDLSRGQVAWGDKELKRFESLRLDSATFAYPHAEDVALNGANLEVSRGMKIGLVGPSGSGKSTATRLILGLLNPTSGSVLVNGTSVHLYDRKTWSRRVGVVPQHAQVLAATIADNLRFYREGVTEEDLWVALEIANLCDEIRSMPEGLRTMIGPGHRALSGGQQQRLAIARALAARPELVVMDEPTSSIDALSEATISDALDRIPDDVTLVIVSHRPRILENCDQIVVIESGHISHLGAPEEVLSRSAYLKSLRPT